MKSNLNNFANHKKYRKEIVMRVWSLPKNKSNNSLTALHINHKSLAYVRKQTSPNIKYKENWQKGNWEICRRVTLKCENALYT